MWVFGCASLTFDYDQTLMLFRTQFSKSTDLSVAWLCMNPHAREFWTIRKPCFLMFAVTYVESKPHRGQTRWRFPLEQRIWSRVLGNVNVSWSASVSKEHGLCASLPAVFGNIYYIYDFFAQCTSIVNLSRSRFCFSTVHAVFWRNEGHIYKQRSLSAVTPAVVCWMRVVCGVSVSCCDCLDWSMEVLVASLHAFNCHLETVSSLPGMERNVSDITALIEAFWENCYPWLITRIQSDFFFHFSNIGSVWFLLNCIRFQSSIWPCSLFWDGGHVTTRTPADRDAARTTARHTL